MEKVQRTIAEIIVHTLEEMASQSLSQSLESDHQKMIELQSGDKKQEHI